MDFERLLTNARRLGHQSQTVAAAGTLLGDEVYSLCVHCANREAAIRDKMYVSWMWEVYRLPKGGECSRCPYVGLDCLVIRSGSEVESMNEMNKLIRRFLIAVWNSNETGEGLAKDWQVRQAGNCWYGDSESNVFQEVEEIFSSKDVKVNESTHAAINIFCDRPGKATVLFMLNDCVVFWYVITDNKELADEINQFLLSLVEEENNP